MFVVRILAGVALHVDFEGHFGDKKMTLTRVYSSLPQIPGQIDAKAYDLGGERVG